MERGGRGRINIFIGHSNKRKETKACGEADGSVWPHSFTQLPQSDFCPFRNTRTLEDSTSLPHKVAAREPSPDFLSGGKRSSLGSGLHPGSVVIVRIWCVS